MSTPENIRFYAAGFLGGAITLIKAGEAKAASALLTEVLKYMELPSVESPRHMRDVMADCIARPLDMLGDIQAIEGLFTHPANTALEQGGIRMGPN